MKIILFNNNFIYIESNLNNYYYFNKNVFYKNSNYGNFVNNFISNKDYCNCDVYFYAVSNLIKNNDYIMLQYIPRISKFKYDIIKELIRNTNNSLRCFNMLQLIPKNLKRRFKSEYNINDIDYLINKLINENNNLQ